jgi:branched-chain amino acid transport system permease protein
MTAQVFQEIINGLVLGSTYALVAIGFNVIYGVVGILNVAQGDIAIVGSYAGLAMLTALGLTAGGAVATAGAVGAAVVGSGALGLVLYFLVLKRISSDQLLGMFVATIGVSLVIEYGLARLEGSYPKTFPPVLGTGSVSGLGLVVTRAQITVVACSLILAALVGLVLTRTAFGRHMRAVAENADVAAAFGVNVGLVRLVSVVGTSMIAGLAGFLLAGLYSTADPFLGQTLALNMFVVSIVGGASSISGAVVVSAALGIATSVAQGYTSASIGSIIPLCVLVVFLIIRPQGLFAASQLRRG